MRNLLTALLAILLLTAVQVPEADRADYEKAARTILCDCGCHPQSAYDCACGRAEKMRAEIAARVRSGLNGEEVIEEYVARGGEKVRIAPTARGFNLLAWLGPGTALVLGIFGVLLVLRRWRHAAPSPAESGAEIAALDEGDLARLEKEMRDLE